MDNVAQDKQWVIWARICMAVVTEDLKSKHAQLIADLTSTSFLHLQYIYTILDQFPAMDDLEKANLSISNFSHG